jgi:hypothetical protein
MFACAFEIDDTNEFMKRADDLPALHDISQFLAYLPCEHWKRYFDLIRVQEYLSDHIKTLGTLLGMLHDLPSEKRWAFLMICPGVKKIFVSCLKNHSSEEEALVHLLDPQAGDINARRQAFELMASVYDTMNNSNNEPSTVQKFSFFMKVYEPPCREIYEKLKVILSSVSTQKPPTSFVQ